MPDFQHGKLSKVYLNGVDLSRVLNSSSVTAGYDTSDTTTFSQGYQSVITGLRNGGEATFDGRVETAATRVLRQALRDAEGRDDSILTISNGQDLLGTSAECMRGAITSKEFSATAEDIVSVTVGFAGNRGVDDVLTVEPGDTVLTVTGTGVGVDDDAASPATVLQAIGYLHVLEITGGTSPSLTMKIQDSPDNSVWTDLVTFSAATAARTAQRVVVADTPARYFRASWTITGTPTRVRAAVAIGRGRPGEDLT